MKTNNHLTKLTTELRKQASQTKADLWKAIADELEAPSRQHRVINLSRLNRYTNDNETVIVPGKVLGSGVLDHKLTIAALAFSKGAIERVAQAKGNCITIMELMKQNPQGKNAKVIG
ncbi:50S ribosomal protein L18e [Candidatus Woesearchaeota archaeon]|nr:50S ribosomal protein L18e [Candidatus Woesearchaeota archaeon]